ncbi:hypothetical protein HYPGJ_20985 [Hyphomicrobium sp. GJ21]|nr:hypothetical protein HYPGJ_20985 [Hyphomicrobium sp. GJ21]
MDTASRSPANTSPKRKPRLLARPMFSLGSPACEQSLNRRIRNNQKLRINKINTPLIAQSEVARLARSYRKTCTDTFRVAWPVFCFWLCRTSAVCANACKKLNAH